MLLKFLTWSERFTDYWGRILDRSANTQTQFSLKTFTPWHNLEQFTHDLTVFVYAACTYGIVMHWHCDELVIFCVTLIAIMYLIRNEPELTEEEALDYR